MNKETFVTNDRGLTIGYYEFKPTVSERGYDVYGRLPGRGDEFLGRVRTVSEAEYLIKEYSA